jgi:hypothetical protein
MTVRRPPPIAVHPGHCDLRRGEPRPQRNDVDAAIRDLNRIYIRGGLRTVLAIGRYLRDELFGGRVPGPDDRGASWISFGALCQRDDLAMSRSYLSRAMQVLEQYEQLPGVLADQLTYSNHLELLPVHDPGTKLELASAAADGGWTRLELRRRVWDQLGDERPGSRPTMSPPARAIHGLDRRSRDLERETRPGGSWEIADIAEQERLAGRLDRLIGRLAAIETRIGGTPDPRPP